MEKRQLVDQITSINTDIVQEVRRALGILHNLRGGIESGLLQWRNAIMLIKEAEKHLAKITD